MPDKIKITASLSFHHPARNRFLVPGTRSYLYPFWIDGEMSLALCLHVVSQAPKYFRSLKCMPFVTVAFLNSLFSARHKEQPNHFKPHSASKLSFGSVSHTGTEFTSLFVFVQEATAFIFCQVFVRNDLAILSHIQPAKGRGGGGGVFSVSDTIWNRTKPRVYVQNQHTRELTSTWNM